MRYRSIILLIGTIALFSCTRVPLEPVVPVDLSLDDLTDMEVYTASMMVECNYFQGQKVERVLVNGVEAEDLDVLELRSAGYYRIEIYIRESGALQSTVIRVVILDPERGETEWGLPPWTPQMPAEGAIGDQAVKMVYPSTAPAEVDVPLIVLIGGDLTASDDNLDAEIGSVQFRIKRGVGSVQLPVDSWEDALVIDHRNFLVNINAIDSPPLSLSGELEANTHIPAGSYLRITDDLTIPEGLTLSIGSGSFITVDPDVNIYNNGLVYIAGSAGAPVTMTCSDNHAFWGGFIGTSAGNRLEAAHTIFSRSGSHTDGWYSYGHAGRQALFYMESGELRLDYCYICDHAGQIFYPVSSDLELSNCLVQRVKTGGQMNQSELVMDQCVFTDFPDDSEEYRDEDNDGLYLNETNALINNSIFMYAKDDGLDSGASGGGEVIIDHCRFEANYHEGAALSSGQTNVKLHRISNSLFINCGQGLELGYSSPNHQVEVDSCSFIGNGIGIRYGDCYEMPHRGFIHVANSQSLDNSWYDVWNMNREHWAADTSHMSFDNVRVSSPNPMYPELILNE